MMDVTDDESVNDCAELVEEWINEDPDTRSLHALLNNAGVGTGGEIDWLKMSDFEFDMSVNYFGMVKGERGNAGRASEAVRTPAEATTLTFDHPVEA